MHLSQRIIRTRALDDVTDFAYDVWVGTPGGSALGTDPNPNTTPPSAGRIIRVRSKRGSINGHGQLSYRLSFIVTAGTITLQCWFLLGGIWMPTSSSFTVSSSTNALNIGCIAAAQFFPQIIANAGTPCLGYNIL